MLRILTYLLSSVLLCLVVGSIRTYFFPKLAKNIVFEDDNYLDLFFPDGLFSWDSLGFMVLVFTFLFSFLWGAFKIMIHIDLHSNSLKNSFYLFSITIFLVFFFLSAVLDLDLSLLESNYQIVLVFPLLDQYHCNTIFFRLFFYLSLLSLWLGPLLITILISYQPWLQAFRAYIMGTLLGVQLSLFYYGFPSFFRLIQQYKNYQFYQQGVLCNSLVDNNFIKVLIKPTQEQIYDIIKQVAIDYPQMDRVAEFSVTMRRQFFDLLTNNDLTEVNLLFQELKNFHGPWLEVSTKKQYILAFATELTTVDYSPFFSCLIIGGFLGWFFFGPK